ncbi:NAD+ synthase [Humidisolicoccus flavus]|uniref:NAD+ synthase n=1 Tax=Humidisolicoccus flavus TaxID=3111414 RepID=UPI0032489947
MASIRLALGQTNPTVGDLRGNSAQTLAAARKAFAAGADLFAVGEMALSGYPIEDLAARPNFLAASRAELVALAKTLDEEGMGEMPIVVGHPDGPFEPRLLGTSNAPTAIATNSASVLHRGAILGTYTKHHLPNYSVFDEYRIFIPGDELLVVRLNGVDIALVICEDLWREGGPVSRVLDAGAEVLLTINASPFERDKDDVRLPLVARRARETKSYVAYVNIVGGQDDLVFDGDSVVVDPDGTVLARAPQFSESLLITDLAITPGPLEEIQDSVSVITIDTEPRERHDLDVLTGVATPPDDLEQIWNALVLGLRDYVQKNGFKTVALGLSGGIDSAVCAIIAADAIGAEHVYGVSMPSQWSSDHSRSDAEDLAERIGLHYETQAIADLVAPIESQLELSGLAAENVQARVRGVILMGLSNMHGHLILSTGNKTEVAVGYSTIYGDTVGGYACIKDVPKTLVWELAEWRNAHAERHGQVPPIPENSIAKPPSAELRPGQVDQDSLPPYPVLDGILERIISQREGRDEIIAAGYSDADVDHIISLVDRSEWKRRQGAIGPKISGMAFGRDRRLPITYRPSHIRGEE